MKKYILLHLLQKISAHPSRKKIFISIALVSFAGFLFVLSALVWLSFSIFGLAKDGASTLASGSREVIEQKLDKISQTTVNADCVKQLQSLSSVNVIFGTSLQETYEKVKTACLSQIGNNNPTANAEIKSNSPNESAEKTEPEWK